MRSEEFFDAESQPERAVQVKSEKFAIRIVRLYQFLTTQQREFVMSKQILRSGTSIGANIAEAEYGISRSDFLSKLYIALKECAETIYWLKLLYRTEYITLQMYRSMIADCEEIRKILSSSTKTTKETKPTGR